MRRLLVQAGFRSIFVAAALAGAGCKQNTSTKVSLPPPPLLSPDGYKLILDYEVGGGERYYNAHLSRPSWPGHQSGVTAGVGYDLGYNSRAVILQDWRKHEGRDRLSSAAGIKGGPAKAEAKKLSDILVSWGLAEEVFNEVTLARFHGLARRTFPGFDKLHSNAKAALVSLVFNRGSSMVGDSRREMRQIRDAVARGDYKAMAAANRASVRIWRGTSVEKGLTKRRFAEADLMERYE